MQRLQFGARSKSKIFREAADEFTIRLACTRALAAACKPGHVRAQCGLIQRIRVEELRRQVDGPCRIAVGSEAIEGCVAPGESQAVALEGEPARPPLALVVVKSGKQFAAAQGQGVRDTVFPQRRFESEYVGVGFEANGTALQFDPARPWRCLQAKQRLAQVRVRELVLLLRPQHRCELRARNPGTLEREKHEQLIAPLERQREGLATVLDRRRAEQDQAYRHRWPRTRSGTRGTLGQRTLA